MVYQLPTFEIPRWFDNLEMQEQIKLDFAILHSLPIVAPIYAQCFEQTLGYWKIISVLNSIVKAIFRRLFLPGTEETSLKIKKNETRFNIVLFLSGTRETSLKIKMKIKLGLKLYLFLFWARAGFYWKIIEMSKSEVSWAISNVVRFRYRRFPFFAHRLFLGRLRKICYQQP